MNSFYRLGWFSCRFFFRLYFRWRVYQPENVPLKGPVLLVSNHASYLDPPLLGASLKRELHFLARSSLFNNPLSKVLFHYWNAIPIERDRPGTEGLKATLRVLSEGKAIVVFPEGTRSPDGEIGPARSGIGLTIVRSDACVVPVRLFGPFEAFGRHHKFPRPARIAIRYGRPLDMSAPREAARQATGRKLKEIYRDVADSVMTAIAELKPEHEQRSRNGQ